jgi:small conductance mechanosensitive channel
MTCCTASLRRALAGLALTAAVLLVVVATSEQSSAQSPSDPAVPSSAPSAGDATTSTIADSTSTPPSTETTASASTTSAAPTSTAPEATSTTRVTTATTATTATTTTRALAQEPGDVSSTTLPTRAPEGFSEEQFQTFLGVVTACGPDPGVVCSRLLAWTDNRTLAEAAQWVSDVPVRILLVLAAAVLLNWLVRRSIARYIARLDRRAVQRDGTEPGDGRRGTLRLATASSTRASAASVVIFSAAAVVALAQVDISLGPLLAGAGILGVALGFGAQNVVRDVLAGVFVIVEDQYGIGDVIDVGRASGVVEGISLRSTKLRDVEGTLWFVPNGLVNEVGNLTQRWARVILDVGVAYGSDHHQAERLIKDAADSLWTDPGSELGILEEPELWGVEMLGDSSVSIRVAVRCTPADQWAVGRALRSRIKDRLDLAGIEIPFPQQSVWVRAETTAR